MGKNEKGEFRVSTGLPSMLMIFVILCLTVFAVLSYVTANADYRLTGKTLDSVSAYYEADAKAQRVVADIDQTLAALAARAGTGPGSAAVYRDLGARRGPWRRSGFPGREVFGGGCRHAGVCGSHGESRQLEVGLYIKPDPRRQPKVPNISLSDRDHHRMGRRRPGALDRAVTGTDGGMLCEYDSHPEAGGGAKGIGYLYRVRRSLVPQVRRPDRGRGR